MSSDDYVTVTTVLRHVREKSIYVDRRPGQPDDTACIPRSLIHGGNDLKLEDRQSGDEITIKVRRWKADELGLLETKSPKQRELFG